MELKRHVGVSCPTAWLMHHKIMTAMATREAQCCDRHYLRSNRTHLSRAIFGR